MSTKTKKKLCWNCEGEVLLTASNCPFCGVNVEADSHTPPYKLQSNPTVPQSPYGKVEAPQEPVKEEKEHFANDPKSIALSIAFMVAGSTFALFGLVLWLFSDVAGNLTLQWKAEYWFIYVLSSLPMVYLGWKASQSPQEEDKSE